ncbi:peptidase inhibitor family I36 protein [Actinoplanes xinjiangensis]|uniref:peptidase inhibitor family I36 protein n=1 Tax=Actinoplanes xinjiangensis TaxID=512350 RepID=UPI003427C346
MNRIGIILGIAGALIAGSGVSAAAGELAWSDCPKNSVCFYGQADGDGRMVVVSSLSPICAPKEIPAIKTKSVFNNSPYPVKVTGQGLGTFKLGPYQQNGDMRPAKIWAWVARNDC